MENVYMKRSRKQPAQPAQPVHENEPASWWLGELAGVTPDPAPAESRSELDTDVAQDSDTDADDRGGVLCPRCRCRNLVDDPDGIRCHDCDALAFIDDGTALVRVDHADDLDEPTDPLVRRWLGHRDRILKAHATGKHDRHPGRVVPCPRCGGRMRPDDVVDGRQRFTCPTVGCDHVKTVTQSQVEATK